MSCPDCFKGSAHSHTEPKGKEETLHGVRTYVADFRSDPSTNSSVGSTILFITDAFGFNIPNGKLLADVYAAKTGFRVLVPDIIPGGGVPAYSLEVFEGLSAPVAWWNIIGHLRKAYLIARAMLIFIPFARRTRDALSGVLRYTRSVRAGLPPQAKLGAAGFCWGGLQGALLGQEPSVEGGDRPLLDALFLAHPAGPKTPDEFAKVVRRFHVPTSVAIGDKDAIISKPAMEEIEAALRREYHDDPDKLEVTIYPGCTHGFAVRASPKKANEDEAAGQASEQAVGWFQKYLA
ncbi:alpha/beta-hydrolase [Thozetella sp. PMI_491]|nr:alpha/beta-hydrolase [Thozetella sp. PMI_491]